MKRYNIIKEVDGNRVYYGAYQQSKLIDWHLLPANHITFYELGTMANTIEECERNLRNKYPKYQIVKVVELDETR